MRKILNWLSQPKLPATPVDSTISPEQVLQELSGFHLAESEMQNLSTVITTRFALNRMVSALEAQRWATLQQQIDELATTWSGSRALSCLPQHGKYLLLASQSLVGMEFIHPAFEAAIGTLNECGGFGSVLQNLLCAPIGQGIYNVTLQQNHIYLACNSYQNGVPGFKVHAPWEVISSVGERDFWLRFARKMTSISLLGQTAKVGCVNCVAQLGTSATLASKLASVV